MRPMRLATSQAEQFAHAIATDIARRGLAQGDRYLTAEEAGEMLGVSRRTADRAMALLAKRKMLVRGRSRGTFVGPEGAKAAHVLRRINVLLPADRTRGYAYDDFMRGAHSVIPGVNVSFVTLPLGNELHAAQQVVDAAALDAGATGIVAVSCPREVYALLLDRAVPAVVGGSVYPGQEALPSYSPDAGQVGHLVARHLIDTGRRRILVLMLERWRPGENEYMSAMHRELEGANWPAPKIVSTIDDPLTLTEHVKSLLESGPCDAIVCHPSLSFQLVVELVRASGREVPRDVDVVCQAHKLNDAVVAPTIRSTLTHAEEMAQLVTLLSKVAAGEPLENSRVRTPVELILPPSWKPH